MSAFIFCSKKEEAFSEEVTDTDPMSLFSLLTETCSSDRFFFLHEDLQIPTHRQCGPLRKSTCAFCFVSLGSNNRLGLHPETPVLASLCM